MTPTVGRLARLFGLLLVALAAVVVMVNVHELGHTLTARLLGDATASYRLFEREPDGFCIGCNTYDASGLTPAGEILVLLGGLVATQLAAVGMLWGRRRVTSIRARRVLLVVAVVFSLDVLVQLVQALVASHETTLTGVDLADVMLIATRETGLDRGLLVALLFACAIVHVAFLAHLAGRTSTGSDSPLS